MRPELLAPAGDFECLRAAVENGADAVYFGLDTGFNARSRATNFLLEDVPASMEYLHLRGVKGYVTLNTLIFSDELPAIERTVRQLTDAGVDAVLVQDLGLVRLIRALSPDLVIHASTQMTLTSAETIAVAAELGIERVVLARELSIREMRAIRRRSGVELEAFVHGALCVAYSGQCLTSESLGGRSANRGQCAQACRLPYELIVDGEDVDLGTQQYLLSPQDLAAYALTPELLAAGIRSFKIEGRLKTPEYVANITRHYRKAIDAALGGQPIEFTPDDVRSMEQSFSRGFSPGWLEGCDHKRLVPALSSSKRGVFLGEVTRVFPNAVEVQLTAPISRGDGLVFEGDRAMHQEQGGRVYEVKRHGYRCEAPVATGRVTLAFADGAIDFTRIVDGQAVWKTDDPALTAELRKTFTAADPIRRVPVDFMVTAAVGAPLTITATTVIGTTATVVDDEPLIAARNRPATATLFEEQLARLGHTVYELRQVEVTLIGEPMVPLSTLSRLRRGLIDALDLQGGRHPSRRLAADNVLTTLRASLPDVTAAVAVMAAVPPLLHVLCRTLDQLQAVAPLSIGEVTADFADLREYGRAVEIARAAGRLIRLAPPRIQKPAEAGLFGWIERFAPDGMLARNLAGVRSAATRKTSFITDYSLNVTNELTAQYLIEQGAERITASYDLNREQLLDLLAHAPGPWFEVVLHQHMPLFHMEHCVFCAVLSPGTNKTNCGRPCDRHSVKLRDRVGMEHRLHADVGCRNTLFNATPQSGAEIVPQLLERGVRHFRVELLDDTPEDAVRTVTLYQQLLSGTIRGEEVWRTLHAANRVGVTRGTLEERRNPLAIL